MRKGKGTAPLVADENPQIEFPRKEGWLDKLSPRSILKDVWQKRWVVLAEGEMCYFKEPGSEPLGVVPLSHVEKISGVGNRIVLTMLSQYSSREWKWRATETALDAEQWRDALEEARVAACAATETSTRYTESGATEGKYWKRLDPVFKQQSMIAGRSHRGSVAPGADRASAPSEPAPNASRPGQTPAAAGQAMEVEDVSAPRWARKRGPSQPERSKEVLYMEGTLTKLNKHLGHVDRFYVLNGNKMTGYKNAGQIDRTSTWFMEQLTSIEVVKLDGRYQLSLELNGVEQYDLVGRSEEEIRQWASKLAAAHQQFGGVLNVSDLLHGPSKKSSLYKQLESQSPSQQSGTAIDLWCSNFDDKAGKDLKSFLDVSASLDGGLFAQLESQLLQGTEITKTVMQCIHDCLYGVIVHFIDDWQMQPPALIVALIDWLASYYMRTKRMGLVDLYPNILNLPSAAQMLELMCPIVSGHLMIPKPSTAGKSKFTKRWFSMMGSRLKAFDSSEQEESGAHPIQIIPLSTIVSVERDGKQLKLFSPLVDSSSKKAAASATGEVELKAGRFPQGFVKDLTSRLVAEKEDGTLPFDSNKPFPGYELVEWMCSKAFSSTDATYKVKRRDISQGLAQSLISNGTIARVDGGADWDEDVDYTFPLVGEEKTLQEVELWAEREDSAIVWQNAIDCVRRALTDKSRRRFGSGTPEIKTRFDNEGQGFILDEVQSIAIDVFQKCADLADYLTGSQKLLDHAASYLDDLMFGEDFKVCFDFVFDSFFMKAYSVIINYCKENYHYWRQFEFIELATWASMFEGRVLQYDESKAEMFNVVDQIFFVDLMSVYNETVSQEIQRLILNLISEDIKAKCEPLMTSEGQLKSMAIIDLMSIYNQSLSIVIGTGNAVVATSAIKYTLPVLELFPKTYLQKMQANATALPIEHVVSVLNAFHEGSHCIQALEDQLRAIVPEKFFELLSFDGPSGAFNRAWKEGSKIVAQVMSADIHPLIQKVGDKSWLNGSVTANWLATVRDYFGDLVRWMIPAVLRKLSSDILDDNLRAYVKAMLTAKINIDEQFLERIDSDVDMIKEVFVEFTRINLVSSRIGLLVEFVELLACDYDDVRRGFMSLVLSSDMHIGILEKILELRDCKRSVKKDILDECRGGWEEPEASDDEATYALVLSGVDVSLIPSGSEKFSMFSDCGISGIWPDWKERRDKERKGRIAALKARKELDAQQRKERELQAEQERRDASLAAHQAALEHAKQVAAEKLRDAGTTRKAPPPKPSSAAVERREEKPAVAVLDDVSSIGARMSADLSLSQIRALQKSVAVFKTKRTSLSSSGSKEGDAQESSNATSTPGPETASAASRNSGDAGAASPSSTGQTETVKETMKEKIARQKREAELAAASGAPLPGLSTFSNVVQAALQASMEEKGGAGKETLKEKIARQKREAELAAAEGSAAAPSTPTSASSDAESSMRPRSDSSAGKETLKEKIARAKREAELANASSSPSASPKLTSLSVSADEMRGSVGKETLKEKIARQKMESEMAALSTSDAPQASRSVSASSEQSSIDADSSAGKETLKEKIARQKREAELAAAEGSAAAPSTPTSASSDAESSMRPRSDSSAGKETLKEKIARQKREAELTSSTASQSSSADSSATATESPQSTRQPAVISAMIGGLGARKKSFFLPFGSK